MITPTRVAEVASTVGIWIALQPLMSFTVQETTHVQHSNRSQGMSIIVKLDINQGYENKCLVE